MRKKLSIPYRNRSPYGWWVASCLERFEWKADGLAKANRRCLAYENTILIQAENRNLAYAKILALGKSYSPKWKPYGEPARPGRWVFEGPTLLLAIHDPLEDGAEILWRVHSSKLLRTVRSFVKPKHQLEAFVD